MVQKSSKPVKKVKKETALDRKFAAVKEAFKEAVPTPGQIVAWLKVNKKFRLPYSTARSWQKRLQRAAGKVAPVEPIVVGKANVSEPTEAVTVAVSAAEPLKTSEPQGRARHSVTHGSW